MRRFFAGVWEFLSGVPLFVGFCFLMFIGRFVQLRTRWKLFSLALAGCLTVGVMLIGKSFWESHVHGYDGGYFLLAFLWLIICLPVFVVWSIANAIIK